MENEKLNEYDAIFQWNMTVDEANVYKLAVCYEQQYRKICGAIADGQSIRRNSIPSRSDPRKSNIFRHCWKMCRETRGLLDPHDYKLFIAGNLTLLMLKKAHIEPNSICGDKAWIRYRIYKRKYDAKMAEIACKAPPPSASTTDPKIIGQIDTTKKFLFERCEGSPSLDKLKSFINNGIFRFWIITGKISHYYVIQSPWISKIVNVDTYSEQCSFSAALMRERLTTEVREYFQYEFQHEMA